MRSRLGCETCRQRKLKCDEVKPKCGQCQKGSRLCRYSDHSIFRRCDERLSTFLGNNSNQGRKRRRTTTATQEQQQQKHHDDDDTLYSEDSIWVDVPKNLIFINIDSPCDVDAFDDLEAERLAQVATQDRLSERAEIHDHDHDQTANGVELETYEPAGYLSSSMVTPSPQRLDDTAVLELHLRDYFKEGPASWIGLFDSSAYFSSRVPILAATRPLLGSAICALAAKHLHRAQRCGPKDQPQWSNGCQLLQLGDDVDWNYRSAVYYQQAIGHLKAATNDWRMNQESIISDDDVEVLFASVAVLSFFELMDAPSTAWSAHLSVLTLFKLAPGVYPLFTKPHGLKRPVFWSLARQDALCAIVSETPTRLDLHDAQLWQNISLLAGEDCQLDEEIPKTPDFPSTSSSPYNHHPWTPTPPAALIADKPETIRSNEIVWLLGKVINYLANGDALTPEDFARPAHQRPRYGVTQSELAERWSILDARLNRWHDEAAADTAFQPVARVAVFPSSCSSPFDRIQYELPMCAATMQTYHMAQILLLVNQPQQSTIIRSTLSARLRNYRAAQRRARDHAREICGIGLAHGLPAAVRVHSVQPLFVAGQAFHEPEEQRVVVGLLSGIESELGWATGYHISKLVDEWNS